MNNLNNTTITISKKLSSRLNIWKYQLDVKSVEDVIDHILKIIPASELQNFKNKSRGLEVQSSPLNNQKNDWSKE